MLPTPPSSAGSPIAPFAQSSATPTGPNPSLPTEFADYSFLTEAANTLANLDSAPAFGSNATFPSSAIDPTLDLGWLVFPGLDRTLPSRELLDKLVEVFFSSRASLHTGLINEGRLRQAMMYGPGSPRYPEPVLLHAICMHVARNVSADFWAGEPRYWTGDDVHEFHRDQVLVSSPRFPTPDSGALTVPATSP